MRRAALAAALLAAVAVAPAAYANNWLNELLDSVDVVEPSCIDGFGVFVCPP